MKDVITYWIFDAVTIGALVLLILSYLSLHKFRLQKGTQFFCAFGLLVICLLSPLHVLSTYYLFSAHMTVHVILLLIVAPLLVMSLPEKLPSFLERFFNFIEDHIWLAWFSGIGVMWFWHIPFVFNAMMRHTSAGHLMHTTEILSILFSGMIFSYPIVGAKRKMHALAGVLYLFSACSFCSLLGLMITFAPKGIYYHYLAANDIYGLNDVIRNKWQITQTEDQQAAGLIMWVPCCMVYVSGALYLLKQWFSEKEYRNTLKTFTKRSSL